ncbi:hypothetical protein [Enterovibrio paralichthyis]|uniref:hypothetical protein n=1 Tax=Enterovibrio paralichthyis TaxID=2853805 RepID=UPI001C4574F7|nr:hypothetical protein [Enterovibrio paralichthyis]MBV7296457.1 hypothetical protein [Enterovibrio paralichthyis]
MIHLSHVLPLIDKLIGTMSPKEAVQFKTYKKDRGFILYCIAPNEFQIIENGFKNENYLGDAVRIKKQAKKTLHREFPRSNNAWVAYFQDVESPFDIKSHHAKQMNLF